MKKNKLLIIIWIFLIMLSLINIINIKKIGIKNDGVSDVIPKAISKYKLETIVELSKDENIYKYFKFQEKTNDEKIIKKYPRAKYQSIYIYKGKASSKVKKEIIKYEAFFDLTKDEFSKNNYSITPTITKYYINLNQDNEIKKIYNSLDKINSIKLKSSARAFVASEYKSLEIKSKKGLYLTKCIILELIYVIIFSLTIIYKKRIVKF